MSKETSADPITPIEREQKDYPRASPAEQLLLPRGGRFEDLFGTWPGEIDDGFEEYVLEMRQRGRGAP